LKIATSLLEKKFKKSVVGAAGLNNKYISLPNKAAGCAYIEKDIIYVGNTLCWLIVADLLLEGVLLVLRRVLPVYYSQKYKK
jgi:hypothetical protein